MDSYGLSVLLSLVFLFLSLFEEEQAGAKVYLFLSGLCFLGAWGLETSRN